MVNSYIFEPRNVSLLLLNNICIQSGPMTTTLTTAYRTVERTRENGMVTIQDRAMPPIRRKSMVRRPPLMEPESTRPLATPAPTTPITWQWVVLVGIPAKIGIKFTREWDSKLLIIVKDKLINKWT